MNSLEDRLRDAYRAATGTVSPGSVRQLDRAVSPDAARPPRSRRIVAPLAAAFAVALIVVLAVVIVPRIVGSGPRGQRPSAAAPPRFVLAFRTSGTISSPTALAVENPATGALVARIPSPNRHLYFANVASVDGRNYVAALWHSGLCRTWFYQFRLSRTGQPSALTPYRVPSVRALPLVMAVSRDNTALAYAGEQCTGTPAWRRYPNFVSVVNFATMRTRTWGLPNLADPNSVSLTADGRQVAFALEQTSQFLSAAYLLASDASSGPALQRSRLITWMPWAGGADGISSSVISPDGTTLYCTTYGPEHLVTGPARWQLVRVDVATGHAQVIARTMAVVGSALTASPRVGAVLVVVHPPVTRPRQAPSPWPTGSPVPSPPPSPAPTPSPTGQPTPSPSPSPARQQPDRLVFIDLRTGAVRYLAAAAANTIYFW